MSTIVPNVDAMTVPIRYYRVRCYLHRDFPSQSWAPLFAPILPITGARFFVCRYVLTSLLLSLFLLIWVSFSENHPRSYILWYTTIFNDFFFGTPRTTLTIHSTWYLPQSVLGLQFWSQVLRVGQAGKWVSFGLWNGFPNNLRNIIARGKLYISDLKIAVWAIEWIKNLLIWTSIS
jgi:hypothetical protein